MKLPIPHNFPWITKEDKNAVAQVLSSGQIAQGTEVSRLESEFTEMLGGGGACAVSSGTAALFLALRGLGINSNDTVALPTYACSALLNAINMLGASARLVDIREDNLTINPDLIAAQAKNAKTVIAVHSYGATANINALIEQNLTVVEDCCQSLGGPQGKLGATSVYSFYATKIITGGQGGLIWDCSGDAAAAAVDYRQFDCREKYIPRFNFQMTDIQAAMIRSQFSRLDEIKQRRQKLYGMFRDNLPEGLSLQTGLSDPDNMPYRFVIRAPNKASRDQLKKHMEEKAINCIIPIETYELLHRYIGLDSTEFPVAEKVVDTTLSIPLYPAMSDTDGEYIAQALGDFR